MMKKHKKLFEQKSIRVICSIILLVAVFISSSNFGNYKVYGYEEKAGVIVGDDTYVYVYAEPSADSTEYKKLEPGKEVTVIGETTDKDGELWYQIRYVSKWNSATVYTSYCRPMNISISGAPAEEPDVPYEEDAVVYAVGTIKAINVFVRNEAGTVGTYKLVSLNTGHSVEIIGETTVDNVIWYKVNCTSGGQKYTGWVHSAYVDKVQVDVETDADFEQSLRDAGFPESYVTRLSMLHAKYPNWTFLPVQTRLEWSDVIKAESRAAVNMVQTSANDAYKSVASTEYNWKTNKWVIRDGSGWVTAHPDYIAYCMDPRNFLTESTIFQFESLSYSSTQKTSGVKAVLNGSFMANDIIDTDGSNLSYADAFVSIGQTTGVSPYHLASRVLQEQGKGTSPLISGNYGDYKGYFNYFNVNAFGSPESVLYANGLSHAKKMGWSTRYNALLGGATLLAENYIAKGQDSLYFQKFNVVYSEKLFAHQYMANVTAAITEGQKIAKAYSDKTQSFVFKIPVYLNMPEEAVQFTASGNRNNYVSTLGVSGLQLTPTFTPDKTDYSLIVDAGVSSITVSAAPVSEKAVVNGTGVYNLIEGENIVKVYCKSQSGDTRTYTLTIVKPVEVVTDYTIVSDLYTIGNYITGVTPGTTAEELLAGVSCEGTTLAVLNAQGQVHSGNIATGNKLAIYKDGTLVSTKDIVIYGDVNGDGAIDVLDIIKINRQTLGLDSMSGAYLEAGDANRKADGVDVLDLIIVNRHTLGLATIEQ
ncbi:MAG: cadherin-like beta sandwich domain-containing protein [Agathobacter sp.]|nr:cadherin-like beta sandwich domain-containing protein [Agathobacter sp.]